MLKWVMGGSCAGKKHFMAASGMPNLWVNDGDGDASALKLEGTMGDALVRWQWGREQAIRDFAAEGIPQEIIVCKCLPSVQVQRVLKREGEMKFEERALINEARDVDELAMVLSMELGLKVTFVDTGKNDAMEVA